MATDTVWYILIQLENIGWSTYYAVSLLLNSIYDLFMDVIEGLGCQCNSWRRSMEALSSTYKCHV